MSRPGFVLAIDQGTTSSRAIVFDEAAAVRGLAQAEFPQIYPEPGWVEHDAEGIWRGVVETSRAAIRNAGLEAADIAAIGITNQRETTVVWDRQTGRPIANAIVWQDRRTADACARLRQDGAEGRVSETTGLLLDPYFSATKIAWMLDTIAGARDAAEAGRLAFGTIDSFLLWRLTGGAVHATDATNASRTLLLDLRSGEWSEEMLRLFRIPRAMLPAIRDTSGLFGVAEARHLGAAIPVRGMAGDQQAALAGQACFAPGMVKSTYGTGCFALLHTGEVPVRSSNRLLSTSAAQRQGRRTYALEGAIFVAGAAVQWLRDGRGSIAHAAETAALADAADPAQSVTLVPAFVGLGAPYWDAGARGAIFGLTRGTTRAELARAALERVALQARDLVAAMRADWGTDAETVLRVDGGMTASDWTMQFLADMLGCPVDRPRVQETTALGAAFFAGLDAGLFPDPESFSARWALDRRFSPGMGEAERARRYATWRDAVRRTIG